MYRNTGQPDCRAGTPRWDVCRADNITHTWFMAGGPSAAFRSGATSAMTVWGDYTDINTVQESSLS